jgi:voltage-gated potassium channel
MKMPMPAMVRRRLHNLRTLWMRLVAEDVPRLVLYFAIVLVFGALSMLYLERGTNEGFQTVEDGLWWALVTLTTIGYGDKYPTTTGGHLVGSMVVIVGVGMVGIVTAKIASVLVEKRIKEGRGLTDARDLKGHFVLLGWKPDLHMLVEEILEVNPELGAEKLVLVNMADEAVNDAIRTRFEGLVFIHGDIIDTLALQRANVQKAAKVFILADEAEARSDQEIDARAVMAAMTVKGLAPQAYTCAEVLDSKYAEHLRLARCDEIILSRDYSRFLLVSASVSEGVSHVLHDLMNLTHRRGVATVPIPSEFVGRPLGELASETKSQGKLLIGLLEDTGQSAAIKQRALREAQKTANVAQLVENLRRVKEIVANRPVLNPPDDHVVSRDAMAIVIGRTDGSEDPAS